MCVTKRERDSLRMYERESECVCLCMCVRERARERSKERERERERNVQSERHKIKICPFYDYTNVLDLKQKFQHLQILNPNVAFNSKICLEKLCYCFLSILPTRVRDDKLMNWQVDKMAN